MKKGLGLILLSLVYFNAGSQVDYTSLVNPFVGTGGHGHTFPGATLPYGMVQLSPDTRIDGSWDGCSGYHYSDTIIYGFSHTHLSGTGVSDYGDILLMPFTGNPSLAKHVYRSAFSHNDEKAIPGYYEVLLKDDGIRVRLTTTQHCGFHQYIFPGSKKGNIILDLTHRDELLSSSVNLVSPTIIEGSRISKAWAQKQHVYYVIEFSAPYEVAETEANKKVCLRFNTRKNKIINVRVGISFTGIEGARKNLREEIRHWDFEKIRQEAKEKWNKEFSRIEVTTNEEEQKKNFYTAFYHVMMHPNIAMDVDSSYRGMDMKIHKADFCYYTVFSLWDTFRAFHPLQTIIDKRRTTDFIKTFLAQYEEGGRLPVWELAANETDCMIGYHSASVIADALAKGITDFDKALALEAMVKSANREHLGIPFYIKHGFMSVEAEHESVSKTLEYAYDDWCIAQAAEIMGENEIYSLFMQRSQYWKNLFDKRSGFIRPKKNAGWQEPFDPSEVNNNYTEANGWQYTFFVPHDVNGLITAMGGASRFEAQLDQLFNTESEISGRHQVDITGLIGQYAHGNEPSHHMAYLYNYIGKPWKAQEIIHKIIYEFYSQEPWGLIGNEDCGQMSAWYMMSSMGFYSVTPGATYYAIGSPVFEETKINLENGKIFTIKAGNAGKNNKYIQRIALKGAGSDRYFIHHYDISKGGELNIEMGSSKTESLNVTPFRFPHTYPGNTLIEPVPVITAAANVFRDSLLITIEGNSGNSKIFFTTDGSEPSLHSAAYSEPFVIYSGLGIKAVSISEKGKQSKVVEALFYLIPHDWSVRLKTKYNPQYSAGGPEGIIDGIKGDENWRKGNWQGYQYANFNADIDLGDVREISSVTPRFLQDTRSWILFPTEVEFFISDDGTEFKSIGKIINSVPAEDHTVMIREFGLNSSEKRKARYIRIVAKNFGELPSWHPGAGDGAFIFVDEVEVK